MHLATCRPLPFPSSFNSSKRILLFPATCQSSINLAFEPIKAAYVYTTSLQVQLSLASTTLPGTIVSRQSQLPLFPLKFISPMAPSQLMMPIALLEPSTPLMVTPPFLKITNSIHLIFNVNNFLNLTSALKSFLLFTKPLSILTLTSIPLHLPYPFLSTLITTLPVSLSWVNILTSINMTVVTFSFSLRPCLAMLSNHSSLVPSLRPTTRVMKSLYTVTLHHPLMHQTPLKLLLAHASMLQSLTHLSNATPLLMSIRSVPMQTSSSSTLLHLPTINAALMLLTKLYNHSYIPIGSSYSPHHTHAHLHPFHHLLHPSNQSYMYGSVHHKLLLNLFSTKYAPGDDITLRFLRLSHELCFLLFSILPATPYHSQNSTMNSLMMPPNSSQENTPTFFISSASPLPLMITLTLPYTCVPRNLSLIQLPGKPLTCHVFLHLCVVSHLGTLETSSPLHYFRQFIRSFHLDCPLNCTTSHLPSLFANTRLQFPLIFSSDGSHHAANMRTAAASVLVALTTTTPRHWSTLPVIPYHSKLHLLPCQIATAPPDINQAEAHGAFLSLLTAPTTLPSIIVLDSRVIFDFIFHFYL